MNKNSMNKMSREEKKFLRMAKNKSFFPLFCIFFSILLISLISSTSLGTFEKDSCITLHQVCSNCTYVNLTGILYPNGTWQYLNEEMTKEGSDYNYTFCSTSTLGNYIYSTKGDPNGIEDSEPIRFSITPTGIEQTTSQGINSAVFLFLMLGLTIVFAILGFTFLKNEYLWVLGLFFIFVMFLFVVYDVWLGYEFHRTLTGINDGSIMPEIIFYIFMFILVSGLIVSVFLLFTHWRKLKKWFKKQKQQTKEDYEEKVDWV